MSYANLSEDELNNKNNPYAIENNEYRTFNDKKPE